jgi:peptidoglycan/xylan/chitin deacetylase (PgdA/CDA1 family)
MSAGPIVKRILHHGGLLRLARLLRQRSRAVVLRYHAITPTAAPVDYATPAICLSREAFRVQMRFLKRFYRVVPLADLVRLVESGGTLPPRAVAVTFDDGYTDNHTLAGPILRELQLPATVYVSTGTLDGGPPLWMSACRVLGLRATGEQLRVPGLDPIPLGPAATRDGAIRTLTRALVALSPADRADRLAAAAAHAGIDVAAALAGVMLTWDQVRSMSTNGWTIGAHTVTHVNVALADRDTADAEISASRDAVAGVTGVPCEHFAYTNAGGEAQYFGPVVTEILRRRGFRSATTSAPGTVAVGTDLFLLPRVGVSPRLAREAEFAAALERHRLLS